MNGSLRPISPEQFAQRQKIAAVTRDGSSDSVPAPWGLAEAIRREVRRNSIVTRRELRNSLQPILESAGFHTDAGSHIRKMADEMVDVGELIDLRVDHQRGYAASPSRWIRTGTHQAVVLGVSVTDRLTCTVEHPLQYIRRVDLRDTAVLRAFKEMGLSEESFDCWLGEPSWRKLRKTNSIPEMLSGFWSYYVNELKHCGAPFLPNETTIKAVAARPGRFFSWPWKADSGRWQSPSALSDGVYLGAQPGHTDQHWRPLIIELSNGKGLSLLLDSGSDKGAQWELFYWLLIARGTIENEREEIRIDESSKLIQLTSPVPHQFRKCLQLVGEYVGKWKFHVSDVAQARGLLSQKLEAVNWV